MTIRPIPVDQDENDQGDFWYRVRSGQNGANVLTSEMYPSRSNAKRAARAYIASIAPVPVVFRYWRGPRGNATVGTERIR